MFAVIKTGGKQYKVSAGDILKIERLTGDAGQQVDFQEVFMLGDEKTAKIGTPNVDKAVVKATVLEQARGDKIIVYKKKRRQGYDRKNGHRQDLTVIHIDEIVEGGKSLAKAERKVKSAPKAAAPKKDAAPKKPAAEKKAAAPKEAPAKKPAAKKETALEAAKKTTATVAKKPAAAKKTTK